MLREELHSNASFILVPQHTPFKQTLACYCTSSIEPPLLAPTMTSIAAESVSTILVSCKQTRFHIESPNYREVIIIIIINC